MRLTLRLTGTSLRLTGSRAPWLRPAPPSLEGVLVTEHGEALATEAGEQLLAGPSHGQ